MSQRTLGSALIVVGVFGFILTLAANPLRIGGNPREFGWLQLLGLLLSFLIFEAGLWLMRHKR